MKAANSSLILIETLEEVHDCQSRFLYLLDERLVESVSLDWLYPSDWLVFKDDLIHLLCWILASGWLTWTVAMCLCMEGVDKGNDHTLDLHCYQLSLPLVQ